MTRSAAARRAGMSSIYSRMLNSVHRASMPSFSLQGPQSPPFRCCRWHGCGGNSRCCQSPTRPNRPRARSTPARPALPPNETITTCPWLSRPAHGAQPHGPARNISARTGLPTTTVFSGAPRRGTASGMAASTTSGVLCQYFVRHTRKGVLLVDSRAEYRAAGPRPAPPGR